MMINRSVEVEVACSVEQVYSLWNNMENVPRWMPLVKDVKLLSGTDNLSRWTFGPGAPLLIEWTSRITRRIPLRLIAWESVSGLPNQGHADFFPTDPGVPFTPHACLRVAKRVYRHFLEGNRCGTLVGGKFNGEFKSISSFN